VATVQVATRPGDVHDLAGLRAIGEDLAGHRAVTTVAHSS
jgi:hypothetical protein